VVPGFVAPPVFTVDPNNAFLDQRKALPVGFVERRKELMTSDAVSFGNGNLMISNIEIVFLVYSRELTGQEKESKK
jgi:hypothetical protein